MISSVFGEVDMMTDANNHSPTGIEDSGNLSPSSFRDHVSIATDIEHHSLPSGEAGDGGGGSGTGGDGAETRPTRTNQHGVK
jgi:hypothetical protein